MAVLRSVDAAPSSDDEQIGRAMIRGGLAAGATGKLLEIRGSNGDGQHGRFVILLVDSLDVVEEVDESNNVAVIRLDR